MQAAKFADRAGPMTRKAAAGAAVWATPRVGRVRAWMAVRAARGSVSMQETVAPRISAMLAATARTLDPPRQRNRRWPKVLAGTAMLAAAAAASMAMAMRRNSRSDLPPIPPRRTSDPQSKLLDPTAEPERTMAEPNGMSRTR
jgi:hypothetical protein